MTEIPGYIYWLTRTTFIFWAICLLVVALLPNYRPIAFGLIAGSAVSYVNTKYLARKVRLITEAAANGEKKKRGLGFSQRAAVSVAAVILAVKFPQWFEMYALAGSLVFAPFALIVIGFVLSRHAERNSANERGEKNA